MSDWQERITRETAPAIRGEHELRYRLVAPLIATSAVWADLGCGTGLAAVAALGDARPPSAVLVDLEPDAVSGAAAELAIAQSTQIAGDLSDPEVLAQVSEALLGQESERVVSCFEVVEHLPSFVPLLEWSGALAREGKATFAISVPNDAFWAIDNPYHQSTWSEGAFEELHRLLPAEHTLLRQVALSGSALCAWEAAAREAHKLEVQIGGPEAIATHFIAAFGPRHDELRSGALAAQTDMLEQRRWERQRESNVALAERRVAELQEAIAEQQTALAEQERTLVEQREQLRANTAQFDQWRTYIHELEAQLGKPPAGSEEAMRAERGGVEPGKVEPGKVEPGEAERGKGERGEGGS
ncbi:MAG: methyltransferase domain-containing protein [Solirubrobacteraceae bacterium]